MSSLNRDPAALVRAGRSAFRPDAADRERVLQSLTRTLGDGALLGAASSVEAPRGGGLWTRFPLRPWILGGLSVVVVGTGFVAAPRLWTRSASPVVAVAATTETPVAALDPVASPSPATATDDVRATAVPSDGPAPRTSTRPTAARGSSDALAEEVRLLSRAEQQLSAGQAGDALKTLSEHEQRFPNGALAEERMAARVQSLCALGRTGEAKADLARLARARPRSPHVERARRFCGMTTP